MSGDFVCKYWDFRDKEKARLQNGLVKLGFFYHNQTQVKTDRA